MGGRPPGSWTPSWTASGARAMRARLVTFALVLAGAFILGTHYLAEGRQVEVFALFLALTACVYGGAALTPAGARYGAVELPAVVLVFASSVAGLVASPAWIAVGYLGHGAWDLLHHYKKVRTPVIEPFPPICAVFDAAVGLFVLWLWAPFR
jgi:hypothetical protein